jgi:hypothetical protein
VGLQRSTSNQGNTLQSTTRFVFTSDDSRSRDASGLQRSSSAVLPPGASPMVLHNSKSMGPPALHRADSKRSTPSPSGVSPISAPAGGSLFAALKTSKFADQSKRQRLA